MSEIFENTWSGLLVVLWLVISICINIVFVIEQTNADEHGEKLIKIVFYPEIFVWNKLKDEVNIIGLILAEVLTFPFFICNNVLVFIIYGCEKICEVLWHGYIWIFRRRNNNE